MKKKKAYLPTFSGEVRRNENCEWYEAHRMGASFKDVAHTLKKYDDAYQKRIIKTEHTVVWEKKGGGA